MKTIHTRRILLACCVLTGGGLLHAGPYEEITQAITATANRQMTIQNNAREREERLALALAKGTHDTAEMKETRAKIRKLQDELIAAERLLKTQFEAVPALQADVKQSKTDLAELQRLDAIRRDLLEKRDAFLEKSRPVPQQ